MSLDALRTRSGIVRGVLGVVMVAPVLSLCLFGDCRAVRASRVPGSILVEVGAALSDKKTQWMLFLCAGIYFLVFIVLRSRQARVGRVGTLGNASLLRDLWPTSLMVLAAVEYTLDYPLAGKSTQMLTLIGAAMMGQGAGLWESRKQKAESRNGASGTVVAVLIVLLAGAAVWQTETGHSFQYRGQGRWSGPWDNPNTFGVLMGVGLVLAVGKLVQSLTSAECGVRSAEFSKESAGAEHRTLNLEPRTLNWWLWLKRAFMLVAAGMMAFALVKSYSRGAWVGAAVGMAYLAFHVGKAEMLKTESGGGKAESRKQKAEMGRGKAETLKAEMLKAARSWVALAIISASVGLLAFWSFRHTERAVARRAYTVANANDFSWRNRVAAWEGALQMMAEKPWFGFGWNQPERVYDRYYRAAKVDEGMAIQLNDYFTLGTSLGLPALLCFGTYIGLGLTRRPSSVRRDPPRTTEYRLLITDDWLQTTCRAGAAVLLVGFWFDGGLFKLATGATFWILLELGRADLTTDCTDSTDG